MLIRPGDNKSIVPTSIPMMSLQGFPIMQTGTSEPPFPTAVKSRPQDIQLSYKDVPPGDNVNANVGDTIHLSLPENPSTGYSWQMTASDGIEHVSDNFVRDNSGWPGRQVVGAGGTHEYVYKVIKPGTQTVSAIYKRPWEGTSEGEKTFTLIVNAV